MTTGKKQLEELKAAIELLRDEISLQAHLGKAEAKEELEELEKKWDQFTEQYRPYADEAGKTAENTAAALGLAADELKSGYERLKKMFKE